MNYRNFCKVHSDSIARTCLSGLIIIYLLITFCLLAPAMPLTMRVKEVVWGVWVYFGFNQNWNLFAPDVRKSNFHVVTWLGFEDGTICSYELPRVELMDLPGQFVNDKFRKWDIDTVPWVETYGDFWPALARYVGRLHYDPHNKPVWFMLSRFEGDIPEPGASISRDRLPEQTRFKSPYFYKFDVRDFQ